MTDHAEKTREHLAERVERFNATTDPGERVTLYAEIEKLRADLREMGEEP